MALTGRVRVVAIVIALCGLLPNVAQAASQNVVIQNFSFVPPTTTINVGDGITWRNMDPLVHTATSDTGAFNTGQIDASGGTKTVAFAVAGTFAYHCSIHLTMKGTIVVLGTTPTTAPPTPVPTPRPTPPPQPTATPVPIATPAPSPSPSASPSPSPSVTASPAPTVAPSASSVPPSVALASPSPAPGAGPDLGSGPGPLIAAGGVAVALGLAGFAFYLYRRR